METRMKMYHNSYSILFFSGRVVIGLFGETVPKTAGKELKSYGSTVDACDLIFLWNAADYFTSMCVFCREFSRSLHG